ncbi:ShlB/FhaC/HecB family hemolysin secretion/activation protein, partial [Pseudomonas chlororaphis]|nr:ShlB/FhaC/HecB family hemolysin secretion/activation protein [Pseudomonas chlororaphis]
MSQLVFGTRLCLALLCICALNTAHAAPLTPGDTDLIRDRQDRLLDEQRRRLEELKDLPGKAAAPVAPTAPADTRCFPIKSIDLQGADALSAGERE